MLKGAIHIHSSYSDGDLTLAELKRVFASAGCAFLCVTDHAEAFDAEKLKSYLHECASLSNGSFCFVPGLEYECQERMHILGYGVTSRVNSQDPPEVIRHIRSQGGIAVIAHPKDAAFSWIENFPVLPDGIETWNSKYDGQYAPRPGAISLLHRLQRRKPDLHAFYGLDLHWKNQFRGLFTFVRCQVPVREEILAALMRGDYFVRKAGLELLADGRVPDRMLERFAIVHARSSRVREWFRRGKGVMDRFGVTVPASIKSQLRRIF